MIGQPIDLPEWLSRLGFTDDEYVQAGEKLPGGAFRAAVGPISALKAVPQDRDMWVGPNPVEFVTAGRAGNDQVTRLAALHIDLDVKPGGCSSFEHAHNIVDELAGMLGTRPVAVTFSGHGVQPVWAIEDGGIDPFPVMDEFGREHARALMRRWGRLVAAVAERHGAHVDALWDLTRILRCPGSVNHKVPTDPIPVMSFADTGAPLTVERILETLDEWGVTELPEDAQGVGEVVAPPAEWTYANQTCGYATTMIRSWATDQPAERHRWLIQNAPRIAAAVRYGCFDRAGHQIAVAALTERFAALLGDTRKPTPGEVSGALSYGQEIAACMSDSHLASELGFHLHAEPTPAPPTERSTDGEDLHAADVLPPGIAGGAVSTDSSGGDGHGDDVLPERAGSAAPVAAQPTKWDLLVDEGVNQRLLRDEVKRRYEAISAPPAADLDAEYLDAADLGDLPKPDPLIDGVLSRHCYMVLRGRDGTFKSFVALDWALCVATGKPWQDHPAERARVLYVAGEGAYGMDQRIQAWCMAWQRRPERGWFTLRKSSVNLYAGGPALDHLIERIQGDQVGLVVIDTLRRASGGADGNSSDMGIVVDAIDRIKQATTHGSVLVIAHTDKSDTDSRGYSGIEDDADIIWHAKRDEESGNSLELSNSKMKDGPDGAILALETVTVMESLVIQAHNGPEPAALLDSDSRVMAAMRDVFASTGATANELGVVLEGMAQATLYRAVGRLEAAGRLVQQRKGNGKLITLSSREAATRREEILRNTRDESDIIGAEKPVRNRENRSDGSMIVYHPADQEILTDSHRLSPHSRVSHEGTPHVVGVHDGNDHENLRTAADPFGTGLTA